MEETCDTIGVLGAIVNLIASLQVAEAMKLSPANPAPCTVDSFPVTCGPAFSICSCQPQSRLPRLRQT